MSRQAAAIEGDQRVPGDPAELLYLDNHLAVWNKPAGEPVVADDSGDTSSQERVQAFLKRRFDKPGNVFAGVVHRLDRPVSGAVVFARTSKAAARVSRQLQSGGFAKHYWARCCQAPRAWPAELEQWLSKDARHNRVTAFRQERDGAKRALTRFTQFRAGVPPDCIQLEPVTGRSHQLRVACASLKAPLLGDLKYGAPAPLSDRSVALHARSLGFEHPTRKEPLTFLAPLPVRRWWSPLADLT
ncbi:MAG: RluA family pseudouridine synthase [Planctomycetota bacterium]